ncbi:hypothetical protein BR93DRAFT_628131 [Coniochaeta sp. PMI_546]|nr:hypothetical protein BR93DRAFT_628131 [Coniochaeta sp. PMI_546]
MASVVRERERVGKSAEIIMCGKLPTDGVESGLDFLLIAGEWSNVAMRICCQQASLVPFPTCLYTTTSSLHHHNHRLIYITNGPLINGGTRNLKSVEMNCRVGTRATGATGTTGATEKHIPHNPVPLHLNLTRCLTATGLGGVDSHQLFCPEAKDTNTIGSRHP